MKGLLIKDFRLIKTQKTFVILIAFVCGYLLVKGKGQFAMTYAGIILPMLVVSTVSFDDSDNGMSFLLTLPVSRKAYVLEKYLLGMLLLAAAGIAAGAVMIVTSAVTSAVYTFRECYTMVFGSLLTVSVILSIALPFQMKFGAEKGRLAMAVTIICIGAAGYTLQQVMKQVMNIDFWAAAEPFLQTDVMEMAVILIALIVGMLGISYAISVAVLNRRQF